MLKRKIICMILCITLALGGSSVPVYAAGNHDPGCGSTSTRAICEWTVTTDYSSHILYYQPNGSASICETIAPIRSHTVVCSCSIVK